ncbi:MAG TPA: alpha/beta hydrolase [Alcaligenes sp.]|nr:alpha/beta hydrolase [Alcaligenes sp.]
MSYIVSADVAALMRWQGAQGMRRLGEATLEEARSNRRAVNALLPASSYPGTLSRCEPTTAIGPLPLLIAHPGPAMQHTARLLVYVHGGGWSVGRANDYIALIQALAHATGTTVVAPDFKLAPEHPFPHALHQIDALIEHIQTQPLAGHSLARQIVLVGDSSGGNLCASSALHAARAGRPVDAQVLIYPAVDPADPLTEAATDMPALTPAALRWFLNFYVPEPTQRAQARVSPARDPDLDLSPTTVLITAEHDILNEQIDKYRAALQQRHVPVRHHRIPGTIHTFIQLPGLLAGADLAIQLIAGELAHAIEPA